MEKTDLVDRMEYKSHVTYRKKDRQADRLMERDFLKTVKTYSRFCKM